MFIDIMNSNLFKDTPLYPNIKVQPIIWRFKFVMQFENISR